MNRCTRKLSKGTKSGGTWTFSSKSSMGGQTFNSRYTMVETSPTEWSTVMESKATKAGS